jgi:nuclear cap-binding protein subunit 1
MRRVVELEIRLAYYDRILDTLPEAMTVRDAGVLPVEPPEPVWLYEREGRLGAPRALEHVC